MEMSSTDEPKWFPCSLKKKMSSANLEINLLVISAISKNTGIFSKFAAEVYSKW